MQRETGRSFQWGLIAIAVAMVVSAALLGGAFRAARSTESISTTGSARVRVSSDFAVWRCEVSGSGATAAAATAELKADRDRLLEFLAGREVPESTVSQLGLSLRPVPEYGPQGRTTGKILRHDASQTVVVRSPDVDLVEELAHGVEELMVAGVSVAPRTVEYLYTQLDQARVELMSDATRDALERARRIAEAAGGEVGAVREARMGVIQVVAPESTNVSDYGMYDTTTRDKDIVAVVKVRFAVR